MTDTRIDEEELRQEVRDKYREVALDPTVELHFHTGRDLAERLGYPSDEVDSLPIEAVESFAGVANHLGAWPIQPGSNVIDIGSGSGLDSLLAARATGPEGRVIGVDMTPEMTARARRGARAAGAENVEFCYGLAEELPVPDGWADVVISNGVLNLVADKARAFGEIRRALKPGGTLEFSDIANGRPVPEEAVRDIDLWTA